MTTVCTYLRGTDNLQHQLPPAGLPRGGIQAEMDLLKVKDLPARVCSSSRCDQHNLTDISVPSAFLCSSLICMLGRPDMTFLVDCTLNSQISISTYVRTVYIGSHLPFGTVTKGVGAGVHSSSAAHRLCNSKPIVLTELGSDNFF